MAAIQNSLNLTDRMSPVLKKVLKAMDSTLKAMESMDKMTKNAGSGKVFRNLEKDLREAERAMSQLESETGNTNRAMNNMASSAEGAFARVSSSGSQMWQSLASGIYVIRNIADELSDLMKTADSARSYVARIGLFNTSQKTNEDIYNEVFQTALATRTGLDQTSDLVYKLMMSGAFGESEQAPDAAVGMASIINKALVAGGGTAEENARALLQLNQALASGILQGDELRSIREQAPYLAKMLAKGLGNVDPKFEGIDIGDLKQLGAEGELTTDRIVKAFASMSDEIDAAFKKMPRTFGQGLTQMGSIWQYFLLLLSQGDGALARLNEKLWEFVDYLQTPAGIENLERLAGAFNVLVEVILAAVDLISLAWSTLSENANLLTAVFIALGVVSFAAGIQAAIAWIAACWPVLLVLAAVVALIYVFLQLGFTAGEIIGAIAGAIMFLVYVIWDAILVIAEAVAWIAMAIWDVIVGIVALVIHIVQAIIQLIIWLGLGIGAIAVTIGDVIYSVVMGAWGVISGVIVGLYAMFVSLGEGVLSILYAIASAIDWVFGSNLASTVSGWMDGLAGSVDALNEALDPAGSFEKIGDQWKDSFSMIGDWFTSDDINLYSEFGAVHEGAMDLMAGADEFTAVDDFLGGMIQNPMDGWDMGYDWGMGVGDAMENIDLSNMMSGFGGMDDNIASMLDDGLGINGGDLDSVGKIKSDVNLNDEDIQLLRDMAARDYLLNLQQITPVAHISFGDVRETADVNKIMDVIEDMVEEQMATALVEG